MRGTRVGTNGAGSAAQDTGQRQGKIGRPQKGGNLPDHHLQTLFHTGEGALSAAKERHIVADLLIADQYAIAVMNGATGPDESTPFSARPADGVFDDRDRFPGAEAAQCAFNGALFLPGHIIEKVPARHVVGGFLHKGAE